MKYHSADCWGYSSLITEESIRFKTVQDEVDAVHSVSLLGSCLSITKDRNVCLGPVDSDFKIRRSIEANCGSSWQVSQLTAGAAEKAPYHGEIRATSQG